MARLEGAIPAAEYAQRFTPDRCYLVLWLDATNAWRLAAKCRTMTEAAEQRRALGDGVSVLICSPVELPPDYGLCRCGCGQTTRIATRNRARGGHRAGYPIPYVAGHHTPKGPLSPSWKGGRRTRATYIQVRMPEHPRADSTGYVDEHQLVAERALGKPLPEGTIVHHVNDDPHDNRNKNLVICQDQAYHLLLHQRARVVRAGGDPDTEAYCSECRNTKPFSEFHKQLVNRATGCTHICKACRRGRDRRRCWRRPR